MATLDWETLVKTNDDPLKSLKSLQLFTQEVQKVCLPSIDSSLDELDG